MVIVIRQQEEEEEDVTEFGSGRKTHTESPSARKPGIFHFKTELGNSLRRCHRWRGGNFLTGTDPREAMISILPLSVKDRKDCTKILGGTQVSNMDTKTTQAQVARLQGKGPLQDSPPAGRTAIQEPKAYLVGEAATFQPPSPMPLQPGAKG